MSSHKKTTFLDERLNRLEKYKKGIQFIPVAGFNKKKGHNNCEREIENRPSLLLFQKPERHNVVSYLQVTMQFITVHEG